MSLQDDGVHARNIVRDYEAPRMQAEMNVS